MPASALRIALVVLLVAVVQPARAADPRAELVRHLDALVALQRGGGWTYASPPGTRPWPYTFGLQTAERIGRLLGMASWDLVVLRSPGTPAAGLLLVRGYRVTRRGAYLAAARRTGDLLLALQLRSGGWFSEMPVRHGRLPAWFPWVIPGPSIDDDVTPGAVRLLLALYETTGEARYREGAARGLDFLLGAQLPSGAWPLVLRPRWVRWLRPSFEDLATLNDGATPATIETLLAGALALGRSDLLTAARRGGDFLVAARGVPPQAGWAQQYAADGAPAAGRRFEPPALASAESRHAIDALGTLAVATGDSRYCAPVRDAVAWLARSALRPGCWARLYALGTNAPLYVAADGMAVASPADARPGYRWTGQFGIPRLLADLDGARARRVPPRPILGDAGTCPGDAPIGIDADLPGDARAHVARAAELLAALEPRPARACAERSRRPATRVSRRGAP